MLYCVNNQPLRYNISGYVQNEDYLPIRANWFHLRCIGQDNIRRRRIEESDP